MTLEVITTRCADKYSQKGTHLFQNCRQGGQNINNVYFLDFHPFMYPLMSDTPSLTGHDVCQGIYDDS